MKYMGEEASYFIVIEIVRDKSRCMLGLSQKNYVSKILQRFYRYACIDSCEPGESPILR